MNRRAFLLGTGSAAVGGTALLTSGAFTRTDPGRNVTVETVDLEGENAYLRLDYKTPEACDETGVPLVELTNQLKNELTDFDVSFDPPTDVDVTLSNSPSTLGVGESGEIRIDIDCNDQSGTEPLGFEIEAFGSGAKVFAVDRTIDIDCTCMSTTGTSIDFVAFPADDADFDVTDLTLTDGSDDGGSPWLEWATSEPVDEVVLKRGRAWYAYTYPGGASAGSGIRLDEVAADYTHKGVHPFRFTDDDGNPVDDNLRCPQSPGDGQPAVAVTDVENVIWQKTNSTCK